MTNAIQHLVRTTDSAIARIYLAMFQERNALMVFMFHSLFRNEREIALNLVDPLQKTTIAQFRQFVEYYLDHGYHFVSPADVVKGLDPGRKHALITFDDGYFNNTLALPILEEYHVPAVFFIATNHIRENKCYWWDVLHRERTAQGASPREIYQEALAMKSLQARQVEAELTARFGPGAFIPKGDVDRPFAPSELYDFARNPQVHLGNHTADHDILTNYSNEQARAQIVLAQESLLEMTGITPISIAYPNGAHSPEIVQTCRDIGLKVGFTIRPEKIALPLDTQSASLLRLGRFCPHGENPILTQCRTYRSDLLLYGLFRDSYLRLVRGKVSQ